MRCATCEKPAMFLFKHCEQGVRYTVNGDPAPYLMIEACSGPCAKQAAIGCRARLPAGDTLVKGPRIGRR